MLEERASPTGLRVVSATLNKGKSTLGVVRRFTRTAPLGAAGGAVLFSLLFVVIFADVLAPENPNTTHYKNIRNPPSFDQPLGSDHLGRDTLSRIIIGSRTSLFIAFTAVLFAKIIGFTWGVNTAYWGGKFDLISQRFLDVLMAIPGVILALLLLTVLGGGVFTVIIAISVSSIAGTTRIIRSVVLSVKELDYVVAATAIGCSPVRVMLRHVAPQTVAPLLIIASAALGGAIFAESALSFLGLGIPPPNPSWGAMLGGTLAEQFKPPWWMVLFPGVAITITILAFNLFGDGLRDHLDPRLRGQLS